MSVIISDLRCVFTTCLDIFVKNSSNLPLFAAVGAILFVSFYFIIKSKSMRSKINWSYALIFSSLLLLSYFAFSMTCHVLGNFCTGDTLLYSIPVAVIGSLFISYIVLPNVYLLWNRAKRSDKLSRLLPISVPVYIFDSGKPFAFSYSGISRWVVVSQGLVDILTKNELKGVLLHEYGHLTNNTSFYKASNWLYGFVPVLRAFLDHGRLIDEEEIHADEFAIHCMGTRKHVDSAKRKISDYFEFCGR